MNFLGIIPARYASTRFPGKPLVDILGEPMIKRVYDKVSSVMDTVYVATDDKRIFDAVKEFNGNVVMTSTNHKTGTDRCYEALEIISKTIKDDIEIVINIQGDEPFLDTSHLTGLMDCFNDKETQIATLIKKIEEGEMLFNPNHVKVVFNKNNFALYFSRSPIPFIRNNEESKWVNTHSFYKHIGIYAYRKEILNQLTRLESSSLEIAESLEQNRWLENGYKIKVKETFIENISVDTPEDIEKIKRLK